MAVGRWLPRWWFGVIVGAVAGRRVRAVLLLGEAVSWTGTATAGGGAAAWLSGVGSSSRVGELDGMPASRAARVMLRSPARTVEIRNACLRRDGCCVVGWSGRVIVA
ncbi:hypothetical protein ACBJ59_57830 [Nonomuraea sp. MTCD27]|uniref:hypothetical protein n=1 Tax=Nonomuraea sp. MTCD27 TaxID=1676747 RepID=UPI0035BFE376